MEATPSRMFAVLRDCGALARILPELDALWGVPQPAVHHPEIDTGVHVMLVLDHAARQQHALPVRVAALLHDLGKGATPPAAWPAHHGHEGEGVKLADALCQRLRIPGDCRDLALMTAREHGNVGRALELRANTIVALFERCDAFRKPQRFADMLAQASPNSPPARFRRRRICSARWLRRKELRPARSRPGLRSDIRVSRNGSRRRSMRRGWPRWPECWRENPASAGCAAGRDDAGRDTAAGFSVQQDAGARC
jgi:hypothetical protein